MRFAPGTVVLLFGLNAACWAQQVATDPSSTHIFPAGGRRGTTVEVRVGGECLPPRTRFYLWGDGVKAPPVLGPKANARYEPSARRNPREIGISYPKEWQSAIEIAPDAALGTKIWRLSCGRGGTGGRPFLVGELPEFIETEPNSTPDKAQPVTLPVTINGQIAGERDVDYYEFSAQEGEIITADVVAGRLGSPLDPVVEFHDAQGHRVRSEQIRVGSDPVLALRVPATGRYRLFVANVSFRGGPDHVYRITLSKEPYVQFAFPPGLQAGRAQELECFALSGTGVPRILRQSLPASLSTPGEVWLQGSLPIANRFAVEIGDIAEVVETEANDSAQSAMSLQWPVTVSGRFLTKTDEDWFRFAARKDDFLAIECKPFPQNSPALPIVELLNASHQVLAATSAMQSTDHECRIEWRAPADSACLIRVRDLRQGAQGGPEFIYRLSIRPAQPDFCLNTRSDFINLLQGGRSEFEVNLKRRGGFAGPVDLAFEGLPPGVRLEQSKFQPGQESIRIALIAGSDARPSATTLRLVGTAEVAGKPVTRIAKAQHLGRDAEGISLPLSAVEHLQLTIQHKPVFRLFCSEAYQYAHRGTIYPYPMQVERLDGFDGPIMLEIADRQNKDLDGIEILEKTIPPGESRIMLPLYLPETMHINVQAHSNVYAQGYVVFRDKWGQEQSLLVVSTMRCMIRPLPPVIKLKAVESELSTKPGATAVCHFELERTPSFTGPMVVELIEPKADPGFTAEKISFQPGQTTAAVTLHVAPDVTPRRDILLTFRATGNLSDSVQAVTEASLPVRFE